MSFNNPIVCNPSVKKRKHFFLAPYRNLYIYNMRMYVYEHSVRTAVLLCQPNSRQTHHTHMHTIKICCRRCRCALLYNIIPSLTIFSDFRYSTIRAVCMPMCSAPTLGNCRTCNICSASTMFAYNLFCMHRIRNSSIFMSLSLSISFKFSGSSSHCRALAFNWIVVYSQLRRISVKQTFVAFIPQKKKRTNA